MILTPDVLGTPHPHPSRTLGKSHPDNSVLKKVLLYLSNKQRSRHTYEHNHHIFVLTNLPTVKTCLVSLPWVDVTFSD